LNFVSQFHDDGEIATAATQTLAHLRRPRMTPPPIGEISEISGFFYFLLQTACGHHH
jgi:hypothetical protein